MPIPEPWRCCCTSREKEAQQRDKPTPPSHLLLNSKEERKIQDHFRYSPTLATRNSATLVIFRRRQGRASTNHRNRYAPAEIPSTSQLPSDCSIWVLPFTLRDYPVIKLNPASCVTRQISSDKKGGVALHRVTGSPAPLD